MKILNKTRYDTASLRRLITEVHRRLAKTEGRLPQWNRVTIVVTSARNRRGSVTGYAYIGGSRAAVRVPTPNRAPSLPALARVVDHELRHLYGQRDERTMRRSDRAGLRNGEWTWANEMFPNGIPVKAPHPKVKVNLQAVRHQRVVTNLTRWQARLKKAQTMVRKYRVKQQYYERQAAKAAYRSGSVNDAPTMRPG